MKKILLASVAGAGLLASCGGDVTIRIPNFFEGQPSKSLAITSVSNIRTDWKLNTDVVDQNGKTIKAGSYVICDNKITNIDGDVSWTGPLSKLNLQLKGVTTGQTQNVSVYPYSGVATNGNVKAQFTIGEQMAPLSIGSQAIIVNPKPVTNVRVKGYTELVVHGVDPVGDYSNTKKAPNALPVMDCL